MSRKIFSLSLVVFLALIGSFSNSFSEELSEDAKMYYAGAEFYNRGDYRAALQFFKAVRGGEFLSKALSLAARIASSDQFSSNEEVYSIYKRLFEASPSTSDVLNFAKFASANGDYKLLSKTLSEDVPENLKDDVIEWYIADSALRDSNDENSKKAEKKIAEIWNSSLFDKDALAADFILQSALGENDFSDEVPPRAMSSEKREFENAEKKHREKIEKILLNEVEKNFSDGKYLGKDASPAMLGRIALLSGKKAKVSDGLSCYVLQKMNSEEAVKKLMESVNMDSPSAWRAAVKISKYLLGKGDANGAEKWATIASLYAPPDVGAKWKAELALGDALRVKGDADAAAAAYLKVSESKRCAGLPAAEALYKLGLISYDKGDYAAAYRYFERVFIAYFHFEYWGSRAYYWAAMCQKKLGSEAGAKSVLREYFRRAKDTKSSIYKDADAFSKSLMR